METGQAFVTWRTGVILTCRADLRQTQELDKLYFSTFVFMPSLASQGSSLRLLGRTVPDGTLVLDFSFSPPPRANSSPL